MNNLMRDNNSDPYGKWRAPVLLSLAAIAASAWGVRRKTQQAERTHPPRGKFIEVDGVRLHYVEYGAGEPIVFLHGNGVMADDFDISGLSSAMAEQYRVIIFDRPGYGYSDRPSGKEWTPIEQARLMHHALERIGSKPPVILGHSWGTLVAIAWALEFPSDVRGLALLSGYYYPSLRVDAELQAVPAIPVIGSLMRHTVSPLSGRLLWPAVTKQMFGPAEVAKRFSSFPVWMSLRPSQLRASALESGMMVASAQALSKRYRELRMPIFIMAGAEDRIANAKDNSARLHEELPQSALRMKEGVGHMVHYDCTGEIVTAIQELEAIPELRDFSPQQARSDGVNAPP